MTRVPYLLLSVLLVSASAGAQTSTAAPPDAAAYAVSYVEVAAPSKTPAVAALKQYRDEGAAKIAKVKVAALNAPRPTGELIKKPLMTYTDEPLVIDAATVWAWTP